jgi:hypothetical protein
VLSSECDAEAASAGPVAPGDTSSDEITYANTSGGADTVGT